MTFVYAQLRSEEILSRTNVLSLLAERVAGKWLRYLLVVDATLVLCGGILAGIFAGCGLLDSLALDGLLPKAVNYRLPMTGALAVALLFFLVSCIILFATSGFNLTILSGVFSVVFLVVMLLVCPLVTALFAILTNTSSTRCLTSC
jgi:amino acid transporter